jgi:hypothetical protein
MIGGLVKNVLILFTVFVSLFAGEALSAPRSKRPPRVPPHPHFKRRVVTIYGERHILLLRYDEVYNPYFWRYDEQTDHWEYVRP